MKTKSVVTVLTTLALAHIVGAQEVAPLEEAQKAARKVNAALPTLSSAPITVDADLDKPHLVKGGKGGVMIIPDKKLTAESLANAGATIVPVGQLWMLEVGIVQDGKLLPADQLRTVSITDGDKDRSVQLYLLGARRSEQGLPELVIFGKAEKPLMTVALSADTGVSQALPLEIAGRKTGEDTAKMDLRLFGRHHTQMSLMRAE